MTLDIGQGGGLVLGLVGDFFVGDFFWALPAPAIDLAFFFGVEIVLLEAAGSAALVTVKA